MPDIKTILLILSITLYRIYFLYSNGLDLYADEAQYWSWAQSLEFGYYSKPPMIAWVIALTTKIFGNAEWAVRLASPILHCAVSLMIYVTGKALFDRKTASLAAIIYITLPAVTLSSALITTDPLLLFCWSCSLYAFIRAIDSNQLRWWVLAGIAAGMGCLSKYNMLLFLLSVLIYLCWSQKKHILKTSKFWLTIVIAMMIYLPNLWWNLEHGLVSYLHTKEISQINKSLFHPEKFALFLVSQLAILGPLLTMILLKSLTASKPISDAKKLLISFTMPFLFIITALSIVSNAYGNWAAPIYITLVMWLAHYCVAYNRIKLLKLAITTNILLACLGYAYPLLEKYLPPHTNPLSRLKGWHELGTQVSNILAQHPDSKLLCDDRKLMAELIYYVEPKPFLTYKWNPSRTIHNHYDMTKDIALLKGQDFILISKWPQAANNPYFTSTKLITTISIAPQYTYYAYYLTHFLGY